MIEQSVVSLSDVDETHVALVGGKGANLGALSRVDGIRVPAGFCVTTAAYRRIIAGAPPIEPLLAQLSRLDPDDEGTLRSLSRDIRRIIEDIAIPGDLAAAIIGQLGELGGARSARGVRRPIQRDGRGPADRLLCRPAGHLPQCRGSDRDHPARQPVLGLAVHRTSRDLPPGQGHRPPRGRDGRGRAADGVPGSVRRSLHGRPSHLEPPDRLCGSQFRPRRGTGLRPGERRRLSGA